MLFSTDVIFIKLLKFLKRKSKIVLIKNGADISSYDDSKFIFQ